MPLTGEISFPRKARAYNGTVVETPSMLKAYRITLSDPSADIHTAISTLSELPDVEYAEPNYTVWSLATDTPDDPYYSLQYGISAISLDKLWGAPVLSKEGPVIAIIDTGVDIEHPDLKANIWTNPAEATGATGYDDDNNGFKDDIHGWDFVNQTGRIGDYNGHGTHCAGIAAACGFNGIGITGANPHARIMPLTVLQSDGTGDIATIIKAVDYATANGAGVISMSLGTYAESIALEQALGRAYQKAVLVAAAGNDGKCLNHKHPEKGQQAPAPMFPGAYTFVLGVQASDASGALASFSNYDDDGAMFSSYSEDKLYNYELTAPGVSIMSTYPGGRYKQLNGTSMATPLVAGAISRLLQAKEYDNRELLFGDLINTSHGGNLDIYAAYKITDKDRRPNLQLVSIRLDDTKAGDGDGRPDAGETIYLYPTFRNTWGIAQNVTYSIKLDELEDKSIAEIIGADQAPTISAISSYAKVEAAVPMVIRISPDCVDGRRVKFTVSATCDNISSPLTQTITYTVENGIELGGIIAEDMTLTADKNYIVTAKLGIPDGVTLTIEPGTTIKFKSNTGLSKSYDGHIKAHGKPGKMITFTQSELDNGEINPLEFGVKDTLEYCIFKDMNGYIKSCCLRNCIYSNCRYMYPIYEFYYSEKTNFYNLFSTSELIYSSRYPFINCNFTNNTSNKYLSIDMFYNQSSNSFSNYCINGNGQQQVYSGIFSWSAPKLYKPEQPNYLGSSLESIVLNYFKDTRSGLGYGQYDLSNMLTRPAAQAHGIVWKVVVDGKDAQDEFEEMPPLGVGRHKFEVYFNRRMNHDATPMVAMGVRPPYTQTAIAEDGSWRTETYDGDEVDIYTAWLTIGGRSSYDGLNRIYVAEAEDDEFFEIPLENLRFNVNVQAAGSLSEGFMAEAGLGRVTLTWDNTEENFDDMLGLNMYRYTINADGAVSDTIRINQMVLEPQETELTDYDVTPGTTYCYYYKVITTSLTENSPSRTVAVTPMTSQRGDANGSGDVDVADVITTVNYAAGMEPKPFIFEAADMNTDSEIDILDVVGIIKTILNPAAPETEAMAEAEASYWIEDGMLYINSPVEMAGVQFTLDTDALPAACSSLEGFEQAGAWMDNNEYLFLGYTLSGRAIAPGAKPILSVGDGDVKEICLSDRQGRNIRAVRITDISGVADVTVDTPKASTRGIYNSMGVRVANDASDLEKLPAGFYIVDGEKTVKH